MKNYPNAVPQDPFRLGFVLQEEPQSDRLRPIFFYGDADPSSFVIVQATPRSAACKKSIGIWKDMCNLLGSFQGLEMNWVLS